jgi:hypothetical protein|tara:strand:+ start:60 stop:317 length:258 start_codon:yes stop_codon:yes gene_type:complete
MKKLLLYALSISFLIVGCASGPTPTKFPGAPKWWTKRPTDKGSKLVKRMVEDGNMRLSWKFSWIKYYPIESTKTYYPLFDYWRNK